MAKEKVISKEEFFQNIYTCALGNFSTMEGHMGIHGIMGQVFGVNNIENLGTAYDLPTFSTEIEDKLAKNHFMNGLIWSPFECIYEYAVNGDASRCSMDEITDCVDFIHILHSDHFHVSNGSNDIITMALARHALEHDSEVMFYNIKTCNYPLAIAHLADIDLRTLKNAISAGEIEAFSKHELSSASLKHWLSKRKGFKPTFYVKQTQNFSFNSPTSFATMLKEARLHLEENFNPEELLNACSCSNVIEQLELGIFELPLNFLPLIAKTYEIPYPILFKQVMQTFYPNEYALLTN
ncbi:MULTISPECIES: hypothetical protein [unclassified Acinetobacter]|uniref:hypothetical protein n=1 Tax=unclassified Acinetobacter TaxID=196816 RepID=UPI0015D27F61|nr:MULTISPECIES: hypothetical protein [unclassified Acinetobacter]